MLKIHDLVGKIFNNQDLAIKIWNVQNRAGKTGIFRIMQPRFRKFKILSTRCEKFKILPARFGMFKFLPARFGKFKILKLTRVNSPLLTYCLVEREERTTLNSIPKQKEYLIYGDLTINGYHRFADKGKKHVIAICVLTAMLLQVGMTTVWCDWSCRLSFRCKLDEERNVSKSSYRFGCVLSWA